MKFTAFSVALLGMVIALLGGFGALPEQTENPSPVTPGMLLTFAGLLVIGAAAVWAFGGNEDDDAGDGGDRRRNDEPSMSH